MQDWEILEELEEYLNGLRICGYLNRKEQQEIMDDCEEWLKTAKPGDVYCYDGIDYELADDSDGEE